MRLERTENQRRHAFRAGLGQSLAECVKVLLSDNYVDYLGNALRGGHGHMARVAVISGHQAMTALLAGFLAEAQAQNLIPVMDFTAEAEALLARAQGNDLIGAMAGTPPDPVGGERRIRRAVDDFCRLWL